MKKLLLFVVLCFIISSVAAYSPQCEQTSKSGTVEYESVLESGYNAWNNVFANSAYDPWFTFNRSNYTLPITARLYADVQIGNNPDHATYLTYPEYRTSTVNIKHFIANDNKQTIVGNATEYITKVYDCPIHDTYYWDHWIILDYNNFQWNTTYLNNLAATPKHFFWIDSNASSSTPNIQLVNGYGSPTINAASPDGLMGIGAVSEVYKEYKYTAQYPCSGAPALNNWSWTNVGKTFENAYTITKNANLTHTVFIDRTGFGSWINTYSFAKIYDNDGFLYSTLPQSGVDSTVNVAEENIAVYLNYVQGQELIWDDRECEGAAGENYVSITAESGTTFNTGEYVSFNFDTNIENYDWVVWGFTNNDAYYLDKQLISFMEIDDVWYQYNPDTYAYDIEVDAPYPYRITQSWNKSTESYKNQYGSAYEHEVHVRVSNMSSGSAADTMQVTVIDSPDYVTIPIYVYSGDTGGLVNNWSARIWEYQPSNTTKYINNKNSPYPYTFKYMGYYQIEVSKSGYGNATRNFIITPDLTRIDMYLGKPCDAPEGYGCINFKVVRSDDWNIPVSGARVTVNNQNKLTNSAGMVLFHIPVTTEYYYTVSKTDYQDGAGTVEVPDNSTLYNEYVYLVPTGAMPTTPTLPPTVTPTKTPCVNCTPDREAYNRWCALFGGDCQKFNWILAIGIILFFAVCVGYVTSSGIGALVGTVGGYVICLGLTLIPIWTFFAMLAVGSMVFIGLMLSRSP